MARKSTSEPHSKYFYFTLLGFAVVLVTLTVTRFGDRPEEVASVSEVPLEASEPKTLADAWQWSSSHEMREYVAELDNEQRQELNEDARVAATINEEKIVSALGDVRIDEVGDVIIDESGLQALYNTMGYNAVNMSDAQRRYIAQVIRDGLPNPAADQVVEVVDSFYEYLQSKAQLDSAYTGGTDPFSLAIKIEDLQTLRRMHFGGDVAEKLFARQHAQELYMLENLKVTQDDNLSEEEKAERRSQLKEDYLARDFGITNWRVRRDSFLAQKEAISSSTLTTEEKSQQLQRLYDESFTADEQRAIVSQRLTEF